MLDRPGAVVVGGGTKINARPTPEPVALVDLQALDLGGVERLDGGRLRIGGTVTLQQLVGSDDVPVAVRDAARREQPGTLRAQATVGGCVATGDAHSELLGVLLVHEAVVHLVGRAGAEEIRLEAVLAGLPVPAGRIITAVTIDTRGVTAVARTARTPADRPIVAAAARAVDGWRRLALTGVAATPILVDSAGGLDPPGDFRGSSQYRRALAAVLLARAVEAVR